MGEAEAMAGAQAWLSELDWIAVTSAAIAVRSVILNFYLVRRQLRLQHEELRSGIDAERAAWCAEVLAVMSAASLWLEQRRRGADPAPRSDPDDCLAMAARLSALADLGRLHFPNFTSAHGAEKPMAFRGHRQPAIDAILLAHDLLKTGDGLAGDRARDAEALIFRARRLLISEVHLAADPRRRATLLGRRDTPRAVRKDDTRKVGPLLEDAAALGLATPSFNDHKPF